MSDLLEAANQGDPASQFALAELYFKGQEDAPRSVPEAVKWYRKAAAKNHPPAQFKLARMFDSGCGQPKDPVRALKLYQSAAEHGLRDAQTYLGEIYRNGRLGAPKDHEKALLWYRKAAAQGDTLAPKKIGEMLNDKLGTPENEAELQWMETQRPPSMAEMCRKLGYQSRKVATA